MANVMIEGSNPSIVKGTIGTNGTLSEELDLAGYNSIGLMIDNASNGTLNFWVSYQSYTQGDVYRLLRDTAGAAVAYTLPSGNVAFKESDIRVIAPYRYVKLGTTVAQANAPEVRFIVKG